MPPNPTKHTPIARAARIWTPLTVRGRCVTRTRRAFPQDCDLTTRNTLVVVTPAALDHHQEKMQKHAEGYDDKVRASRPLAPKGFDNSGLLRQKVRQ